jgi:hypothetical protein
MPGKQCASLSELVGSRSWKQRIDRCSRWLAPVRQSVLGNTLEFRAAFFCDLATCPILGKYHDFQPGQGELIESE